MAPAKILRIYLDDAPRARAKAGEFNIMNKIANAFQRRGFRVEFVKNSDAERLKSKTRRGYSLFYMDHPFHSRALTMRKAYFYPFWRIETSAQRWEWEIARATFDPSKTPEPVAKQFADFWRKRLFPDLQPVEKDQTVYVPLQGRLLERRSFQALSPLDMIRTSLVHEPDRKIVLGLHPGESYLPEEISALRELVDREPRLSLSSEPMARLLQRCDYVVTENSSVALNGFFLHRPAVLFAKIDFHHISANAFELGPEAAIGMAPQMAPNYDAYMHWFLKETAINGGSDFAEDQIIASVQKHGWDV